MPQLIENGHLYSVLLPLYKVSYGTKYKYILNDKELKPFIKSIEGKYNYRISRFKGLGEMDPDELKETAMQTGTRVLVQHKLEDAQKVSELFSQLLGDDPTLRKELVMKADVDITDDN